MARQLTGLYSGPDDLLDHPERIRELQEKAGLNMVILGGGTHILFGLRARDPLHREAEADDTRLRQGIEKAHEMGLEVWLLFGGWQGQPAETFAGQEDRSIRDVQGRLLKDMPQVPFGMEYAQKMFCPSLEDYNSFHAEWYADVARRYAPDSINLTHARYSSPSLFFDMFGCACPRCAHRAEEMGYDFEKLAARARKGLEAIQKMDAATARGALADGDDFFGLFERLGVEGGLRDWFAFRAGVITGNFRQWSEAVRQASGGKVRLGSDTHVPGIALLVGHDYPAIARTLGYTQPLLPHIGWHLLCVPAAWASLFLQWTPGLTEAEALRLACQLIGWQAVGLSDTIADLHVTDVDGPKHCPFLYNLVALELERGFIPDSPVPSYPVLQAGIWPVETVRRLIRRAEEIGHQGLIFQGATALLETP
ncbi:MAG: hypothetical protein IT210_07495 [Armatimonadetes bacterium]|nr:hypothetical protein [Armatimonadota bacterium]